MKFTVKELTAVHKMGKYMVLSDGKVDPKEMILLMLQLKKYGGSDANVDAAFNNVDQMEAYEAVKIISAFDYERKKYVAALLGTIMIADGEIDENELALWRHTSRICSLPTMSAVDALEYMKSLK